MPCFLFIKSLYLIKTSSPSISLKCLIVVVAREKTTPNFPSYSASTNFFVKASKCFNCDNFENIENILLNNIYCKPNVDFRLIILKPFMLFIYQIVIKFNLVYSAFWKYDFWESTN